MPHIPQTFRIFRVSANRNNFGHREYWLINKAGYTFSACRVYDLPLNSEVVLKKHQAREEWTGWAELGFEVPELRFKNAPANAIAAIFAKPLVASDLNKLEMA